MNILPQITDLNARVRGFKDCTGLAGGGSTNLDGVSTRGHAQITFSLNPTAGDTITLNAVVWTFVVSGASGLQTNIGGSLAATLTQLAIDLNASGNAEVSKNKYTVSTTVLTIKFKNGNSTANAFTVAASAGTALPSNIAGSLDYGTGSSGGVFCAIIVAGVFFVYRLRSGTDAESSPSIIRPDDYDASDHQRVWELQGLGGAGGSFLPLSGGTLTGALIGTSGTFTGIVSALNIKPGQATISFSATPALDFDAAGVQVMTVTAAITSMTTANRGIGKTITVYLVDDGGAWGVAGNGSWQTVDGAAIPANLTASKTGILVLQCLGTTEASIITAFKLTA